MMKNLIVRKRHFWSIAMLMMMLGLIGCAPQVTTQTYTHEAGEELPTEAARYAEFKNSEQAKNATVDISKVDIGKVGTYEAVIMLNEKEYPFTVEVVDTTAPEVTFSELVVVCGIDGKVTTESFKHEGTDISEVKYGLRNASLLKNEEELKELIKVNLEEAEKIGKEQISYMEMVDVSWNKETDTWLEKDIAWDSFQEEFIPEENGLYRLEQLCVDAYGNADVSYGYVIADLTAPVFTRADDIEVEITSNFEEYINSLNDGLIVEDNLFGDITYRVEVTDTEVENNQSADIAMKVYYEVEDIAGNRAEASRNVGYGKVEVSTSEQATQSYSNGHDRARAEQAFAQVNQQRAAAGLHELAWDESIYNIATIRAEEVISNYSHTRSATGRTTVEDYNLGENLNKLWGDTSAEAAVQSWMNSPTHKDNLLISNYTKTAVACYQNGKYCYYVQLFD